MRRYTFKVKLANGDEVHAKSVGNTEAEAKRLMTSNPQFKAFVGKLKYVIETVDIERAEPIPYEACEVLSTGSEKAIIHIASGFTFTWQRGRFNETAKLLNKPDLTKFTDLQIATILREVGEYVSIYVEGN